MCKKEVFKKINTMSPGSLFLVGIILFLLGMETFVLFYDHDFYHYGLMKLIQMGSAHEYFIRIVCGINFVFLFCLLFLKCFNRYGIVAKLGTNTLAFYMIHAQIVHFLRSNVKFENDGWYMWLLAVVIAVVVICVSYLFIMIFRRWYVFRKIWGLVI